MTAVGKKDAEVCRIIEERDTAADRAGFWQRTANEQTVEMLRLMEEVAALKARLEAAEAVCRYHWDKLEFNRMMERYTPQNEIDLLGAWRKAGGK